jgi:probable phosphoglycerate mutase
MHIYHVSLILFYHKTLFYVIIAPVEKRAIMILAMVRHGQTHYNQKGIIQGRIDNPLNEHGKLQAKTLGEYLKTHEITFDALCSSPLSRALETAFIIKNELLMHHNIHVIQQFVERDFNLLDGKPVEIGMPLVKQKGYTHPGYEDDEKLVKRVVHQALKLEDKYPDQKVLCVAHSHVIKALMTYADPNQYQISNYMLDNGDMIYFEIKNQDVKVLKHEKMTR